MKEWKIGYSYKRGNTSCIGTSIVKAETKIDAIIKFFKDAEEDLKCLRESNLHVERYYSEGAYMRGEDVH